MKYNLHFAIPIFTERLDTFPIPETENYDYWAPLLKNFIEQSDQIEIHCWNEEEDIITETTLLFKDSFEIIKEKDTTVIKGNVTDCISNYVLCENVKSNGKLKWFSLFLSKNTTTLFHSEHWGTEFFAPNISKEKIKYIKSVTPIDTIFNLYK